MRTRILEEEAEEVLCVGRAAHAPALLDDDGAVGEAAARAEALVHLLHRHGGRLVLGALRRGRGRGVGEPGPRELPWHDRRHGRHGGARRRGGDLGSIPSLRPNLESWPPLPWCFCSRRRWKNRAQADVSDDALCV